ncbi:MAG: exodeoxyribonuclease VII large subunit [Betaproteobacteria bacterium]|nr:exodeoxyribonuclease VII large subunit [Betaproteobacteria bacterium]
MASLPGSAPLTVTEINRRSRQLLEGQFGLVWVVGEISRATLASSGHWYFVLKDEGAAIDCAMFKGRAQYLDFRPENGLKVEVRARVTLYEPRGAYQLAVEQMRHAGLGALFEAFEKLKARLAAEGLFEAARKKPLPAFARAIGVVTSPAAAALRDILTTLARRAPMVPVILYPTPVQGDGAGAQVARAIETANARRECDVLIVARGGGSLEDLWAFNEEAVARAIAASAIPVVSGVGHETDFTIADFVADLRAATPTAAAAAASPARAGLLGQRARARARLARGAARALDEAGQRLDLAARRLLTPAERIERSRADLAAVARRITLQARQDLELRAAALRGIAPRLRAAAPALADLSRDLGRLGRGLAAGAARSQRERRARLAAAAASLGHLDPSQVLARGYAIVRAPDGAVVRSGATLARGDALDVTLAEGGAKVTVDEPRSDSVPQRPGV